GRVRAHLLGPGVGPGSARAARLVAPAGRRGGGGPESAGPWSAVERTDPADEQGVASGARKARGPTPNNKFSGEVSSIVTEVKFTLADLCRPEALPAVCVRCGRKATGFRSMRLTTSEPKRPSSWGWILWELGLLTLEEKASFENLENELRITKGRLKL